MDKNHIPIYQAAACAASALRSRQPVPEEVIGWLASHRDIAKHALQQFGATKLLRQITWIPSEPKTPPTGQKRLLYKAPFPGEQQARLSYEYLLGEFREYLRHQALALTLSESDAHVVLWQPGSTPELDLAALWQAFMEEMTSSAGFSRGFGLVMNASKLTDRGFSTLETPLVSETHPRAVAAFYIANLHSVEQRIARRQSRIVALETSEDDTSSKKLEQDHAMQEKELEKYRSDFERIFGKQLTDEQQMHEELQAIENKLASAEGSERKKLIRQQAKLLPKLSFDAKVCADLAEIYKEDPFVFMDKLRERSPFADTWRQAEAQSKRYSGVAAEQLNTARGDIYAKIIWETCVLLFGRTTITPIEPLLSDAPFVWGTRMAGDNQNDFCYACGRLVDKENRYRSRRLLFESPEQRTQSGGSSGPVTVCTTCAALSLLSPIKFTDDTLVIRFEVSRTAEGTEIRQSVSERVRQGLEQQALNELGASAGRYVNLSCTEKTSDGKPASQRLGQKQYAVVKLASLYPPELLRYLEAFLYHHAQETPISRPAVVGMAIAFSLFSLKVQRDFEEAFFANGIRSMEKHAFFAAIYSFAKGRSDSRLSHTDGIKFDEGTRQYCDVLESEDRKMASFTRDVQAMVGLLMPACRHLMSMDSDRIFQATGKRVNGVKELKDWREREVAKLIQQIGSQEPTTFTYAAAKTVGTTGYLKRASDTRFAYDEAKRLVEGFLDSADYDDVFVEREQFPAIKVTSDLISAAFAYIKDKKEYASDFERKQLFYHVKLGLFSRFQDAL